MGTMNIILIVILLVVIIFVIVTTITGRSASKKEKAQRYQEVRDQVKKWMAENESKKNLRIEFEKVYARKGVDYKYRDVFDVIVDVIEPKTNKVSEKRAFEIEGITTRIDKKTYKTNWIVNSTLDLDDTKQRIAIAEKTIKLTKEERLTLKKEEKIREKELREKQKLEMKKAKIESKAPELIAKEKLIKKQTEDKFIPVRKKD